MYQPDLFGPFQGSPTEAVTAIKADITAGERDLGMLTARHGEKLVRYMRRKGLLENNTKHSE